MVGACRRAVLLIVGATAGTEYRKVSLIGIISYTLVAAIKTVV